MANPVQEESTRGRLRRRRWIDRVLFDRGLGDLAAGVGWKVVHAAQRFRDGGATDGTHRERRDREEASVGY